jgi:hypothetical protein
LKYAKTIKCIVDTIPNQLILNQPYRVYGETDGGYQIEDNQRRIDSYKKYMFEVTEWESE